MKVLTITGMVCMGLGQGVQPLLGYCVGGRLFERFKETLKVSLLFALALGVGLTAVCYLLGGQIVSAFLTDQRAYSYGVEFSRILLTTSSIFGVFYVLLNTLQAMGAASPAFIINLSRQGLLFIPALFLLQAALGITGLVWAQPVADVLSLLLAAVLYRRVSRRMMAEGGDTPQEGPVGG